MVSSPNSVVPVIFFFLTGSGEKERRKDSAVTFSFALILKLGFPSGPAGEETACNVGDLGSIPRLGRSPGEGNATHSSILALENSMDCIVPGVAKSWTQFHF